MTRISNKKENIYLFMRHKGVDSVEKKEGKQLLDYLDYYYVRFEGRYQIMHRQSGLLCISDTNKKSLLEQWESKNMFERCERAVEQPNIKEHIKKFQKLIKEYEE